MLFSFREIAQQALSNVGVQGMLETGWKMAKNYREVDFTLAKYAPLVTLMDNYCSPVLGSPTPRKGSNIDVFFTNKYAYWYYIKPADSAINAYISFGHDIHSFFANYADYLTAKISDALYLPAVGLEFDHSEKITLEKLGSEAHSKNFASREDTSQEQTVVEREIKPWNELSMTVTDQNTTTQNPTYNKNTYGAHIDTDTLSFTTRKNITDIDRTDFDKNYYDMVVKLIESKPAVFDVIWKPIIENYFILDVERSIDLYDYLPL